MAYNPRLTKPEAGNPYYNTKARGGYSDAVKGKPTDSGCDVLSNCVGYAYGRFNEIGGYGCCKYLKPVNAEKFIQYADGLEVGQTPKLGACMVWQKGATLNGSDGAGHVAIVEKIISPTQIVTSESGWNSSAFWTQTRHKGNGNWGARAGYTFLGFIYNPAVSEAATPTDSVTGSSSSGSAADEKTIWDFFAGKGLNHFAVAGIMGNLYAESALRSNNLQQSYERKLGYTDDSYTKAVDDGSYGNFIKDAAGYGLAQWTYWSRKKELLEYAQAKKKSIADLQTQLDFLWKEMQGYSSVMKVLKAAASVREASDVFMTKFENPADQSEKAKANRAKYGQSYYDKYAVKPSKPEVTFEKGDKVTLTENATYANGQEIPDWLMAQSWVVCEGASDGKVVIEFTTQATVDSKFLKAVKAEADADPGKVEPAQQFDKNKAGTYTVGANGGLHLRTGASTEKASLEIMASGSKVTCYGYHTGVWLYVLSESGKTGFCHSDYLTKA